MNESHLNLPERIHDNDIPHEVWVASMYMNSGMPVGMETFKKCQEIVDKYPEYFPWEHKYKSVPQEVHDAYKKEAFIDPLNKAINNLPRQAEGGIMAQINASFEYKGPSTRKEFEQLWQDMIDKEERKRNEEIQETKRQLAIWNKHYKKYGLSYRE